jgi:DNA-directed RNA polymerase specialized sigma24 family protein
MLVDPNNLEKSDAVALFFEGFPREPHIEGEVERHATVDVPETDMLKPTAATLRDPADQAEELQPVAPAVLSRFDATEKAKRLAVLESDKELVLRLMLRGYEGPEWERFASALAEYALQVLQAWIASGEIFVQCARKGFGALSSTHRVITRREIEDLATDTVVIAIDAFRRKVLIPARWDPTKGASLKTFFVGQCVFQFPNLYRSWSLRAARVLPLADPVQTSEVMARDPRPDTLAILTQAARSIAPGSVKFIEVARRLDYTNGEIAEMLSTTEKAIEMKLARRRARLRAKETR